MPTSWTARGAAPGAGPGSIWKIDGATGRVTLFANIAVAGRPNSGPGLGGIAFDPRILVGHLGPFYISSGTELHSPHSLPLCDESR
jgi:hypothetical protein